MSEQANEMTCAELANVAAELALGVLTGRERAEAVAHLDRCEDCREGVRQLMATGEELLALLPEREPPVGFETRVLERLGFGPAGGPAGSGSGVAGPADGVAGTDGAAGTDSVVGAGGGAGGVGARTRRAARHRTGERRPGDRRPAPRRRRGRGPGDGLLGRARRLLATAAVLVAIVGAGLGGWGLGHSGGAAPAASASQLTSAPFVSVAGSSAGQTVGKVFVYQGNPRWLYMSVEMTPSDSAVTCQVVGTDGRVTTIGSFQLANGYGAWGSPDPGYLGTLRGARLLTANGTVLATATFTSH